VERCWKGHQQVQASQRDVIKDCYWSSIRRYRQRYITTCERFKSRIEAVIEADGGYIE